MSLSEVAVSAGLAPSTAYRMLTTLESHGMVEFEKTDQLWSIGVETYRMGSAFLRRRKLVDRARTVMQDLMERTVDRVAQIGPLVGKAAAAVTALIGGAAPSP